MSRLKDFYKDTVMSAIMHLPQTFSKADVKKACPRFSESTIQRALIELRDEGKIKPNGTGRSASWTKIVHNEQFQSSYNQMTIEELLNNQNNKKNTKGSYENYEPFLFSI